MKNNSWILKTILALIALFVIVFAQDIRTAVDEFAAKHGHARRVDVQIHGCASVNGVLYCVDTQGK